MKTKTSVTLSADVLAAIDRLTGDRLTGENGSRSAVIERILRGFIRRQQRAARAARDLATLNRHSGQLNAEVADTLGYQNWPSE